MRRQDGFTLIEVLVVMMIIAILAVIALPQFLGQQGLGHDAAAKSNAAALHPNLEGCYVETEDYRRCVPGGDPGLGQPGVPLGTGPGEVTVAARGPRGYDIVAYSRSGTEFRIERRDLDVPRRECRVPASASGSGGCSDRPNGSW